MVKIGPSPIRFPVGTVHRLVQWFSGCQVPGLVWWMYAALAAWAAAVSLWEAWSIELYDTQLSQPFERN